VDVLAEDRFDSLTPLAVDQLPWVWIKRIEPTLIVEIIDRVRDEPFKAVLFDPVRDRFRKEVLLVLVVWEELYVTAGSSSLDWIPAT
ncbi:MAG: hypothetical protein V5A29_19470, partial [Haloarculaceae archaeon]